MTDRNMLGFGVLTWVSADIHQQFYFLRPVMKQIKILNLSLSLFRFTERFSLLDNPNQIFCVSLIS